MSVLLPTTGRAKLAERCVRSLLDTADGLEIVAAVDADPDTAARLRMLRCRVDYSPEHRGNSNAWNDALALTTGDPIVFAADDLIFKPGWLDEALKVLAEFEDGWGLVGFNDGHWDGNELATHYLMSRRFIVEVLGGVVAWDWYRHSFNDLEVNDRAKAANRFKWAEKAMVRHEHWLFGDRQKDETDTRDLGHHPAAEAAYKQRKAAGFPVDYQPVITS